MRLGLLKDWERPAISPARNTKSIDYVATKKAPATPFHSSFYRALYNVLTLYRLLGTRKTSFQNLERAEQFVRFEIRFAVAWPSAVSMRKRKNRCPKKTSCFFLNLGLRARSRRVESLLRQLTRTGKLCRTVFQPSQSSLTRRTAHLQVNLLLISCRCENSSKPW